MHPPPHNRERGSRKNHLSSVNRGSRVLTTFPCPFSPPPVRDSGVSRFFFDRDMYIEGIENGECKGIDGNISWRVLLFIYKEDILSFEGNNCEEK